MRHDHQRPFDIEADEAADTDTEFWGTTRSWAPQHAGSGDDDSMWQGRTTGSLRAIRSSLGGGNRRPRPVNSTGRVDRTRSHGIVRPPADAHAGDHDTSELGRIDREVTLGELAAGWIDDNDKPDNWSAPTQRVAAVERRSPRPAPQPPARRSPRTVRHVEVELDDDVVAHTASNRNPIQALTQRLGVGAVDPLLARLSAIVLIGVMLVPIALAARSGESSLGGDVAALAPAADLAAGDPNVASTATSANAPVASQAPLPTASADEPVLAAQTTPSVATATEAPASTTTNTAVASTTVEQQPTSTAGALVEPATATAPAKRVEPVCALTYDAVTGDSWYRIAEAAGITPRQLLDANLAMLDTPIFPGDEICLPEGATMPAPPTTTTAPTTTVAPATSTTRPPATTAAPTTTSPPAPPAPTASQAQVQQMIRDIWPDELEDRALEIAYRESRYIATAYNGWCCYGVFQIYYTAHDGWLDEFGVNTATDLFDARKNITAAYEIYQRAGGWGPWGG